MNKILYQLIFDIFSESEPLSLIDYQVLPHFIIKRNNEEIPLTVSSSIKTQQISCTRIRFFCDYLIQAQEEIALIPKRFHSGSEFHEIMDTDSLHMQENINIPFYHIYEFEDNLKLWDNTSPFIVTVKLKNDQTFHDLDAKEIKFFCVRRSIIDGSLKLWDC